MAEREGVDSTHTLLHILDLPDELLIKILQAAEGTPVDCTKGLHFRTTQHVFKAAAVCKRFSTVVQSKAVLQDLVLYHQPPCLVKLSTVEGLIRYSLGPRVLGSWPGPSRLERIDLHFCRFTEFHKVAEVLLKRCPNLKEVTVSSAYKGLMAVVLPAAKARLKCLDQPAHLKNGNAGSLHMAAMMPLLASRVARLRPAVSWVRQLVQMCATISHAVREALGGGACGRMHLEAGRRRQPALMLDQWPGHGRAWQ